MKLLESLCASFYNMCLEEEIQLKQKAQLITILFQPN